MAMPWTIVGRFVRLASLPGSAEAEREARAGHTAAADVLVQAEPLAAAEVIMAEQVAAELGAAEVDADAREVDADVRAVALAEGTAAAAAADFTFRVAPLPRVTILAAGRGAQPDPEDPDEHPYVISASPSFLLVQFDGPIKFGTIPWNHLVVVRDFVTAEGAWSASAERVPARSSRVPVVSNLESLIIVPSHDEGCAYTIAELQVGRGVEHATIIYLRSGPGEADGWRTRLVAYPLAAANRRWRPHGAVHADGLIWWFDFTWGILSCSDLLEDAGLLFHELPVGRGFGERDEPPPDIHTKRWIAPSQGKLRYVEIIAKGRRAPSVSMWTRSRNPGEAGWRWDAEYAVSFKEIWDDESYKKTKLPRSVPVLAVVNPSDPNLVYFSLEQDIFGVDMLARKALRHEAYELVEIPGPARSASGRYVVAWELLPALEQGTLFQHLVLFLAVISFCANALETFISPYSRTHWSLRIIPVNPLAATTGPVNPLASTTRYVTNSTMVAG
ncbi:unnamed protein product [Urochloa humidicola]